MVKSAFVMSVTFILASTLAQLAKAHVIADSNALLLNAIKSQKSTPPLAARALAIFHMAAESAISDLRYRQVSANEQRIRALGALLEVGEAEFPDFVGPIQEWVFQVMPAKITSEMRARALSLGRTSARGVLTNRNGDLTLARQPDKLAPNANLSGFPIWAPPAGKTALHPRWGEAMPIALNQDDLLLIAEWDQVAVREK